MASHRLVSAASGDRSEAEVRAIRARRARMEADLIEEGASNALVARLATDETASRALQHEERVLRTITSLFGGL